MYCSVGKTLQPNTSRCFLTVIENRSQTKSIKSIFLHNQTRSVFFEVVLFHVQRIQRRNSISYLQSPILDSKVSPLDTVDKIASVKNVSFEGYMKDYGYFRDLTNVDLTIQ